MCFITVGTFFKNHSKHEEGTYVQTFERNLEEEEEEAREADLKRKEGEDTDAINSDEEDSKPKRKQIKVSLISF